jgi:hypothetical protein
MPTKNQASVMAEVMARMAKRDNDPSAQVAAEKLRKMAE